MISVQGLAGKDVFRSCMGFSVLAYLLTQTAIVQLTWQLLKLATEKKSHKIP